jgi:hypothetical protein
MNPRTKIAKTKTVTARLGSVLLSWTAVTAACGWLAAGCGGPPPAGEETTGQTSGQTSDRTSAALDASVLKTALDNQAKMEAMGLQLLGRAWFNPAGYAELYGNDADGPVAGAMTFRIGDELSKRPELGPKDDLSFDDYVQRVKGAIDKPVAFAAVAGGAVRDVLLFEPGAAAAPPPGADGVGVTQAALTNQFCDKASFDNYCNSQIGYVGQQAVASWYTTDNFGAQSFGGRGTSLNTVICADAGDSTLTVNTSGDTGNVFPSSYALDVSQGFWAWRWWRGVWNQNSFCSFAIIFCIETDTSVTFERANISVGETPKTGSGTNNHFCGNVMNVNDYTLPVTLNCGSNCPQRIGFAGQGN